MGANISSLESQRQVYVPEIVQEELVIEEPVPSKVKDGARQEREVRRSESRVKVEVSCFGGSLKPKELVDWIRKMEKFFDWDEVTDPHRVKFACTNLRGHAALWWERLQKERVEKR